MIRQSDLDEREEVGGVDRNAPPVRLEGGHLGLRRFRDAPAL